MGGTLAGGCAAAVLLAIVAIPATGQDPPPPCAPGTALTPDRFGFESSDGTDVTTKSLTVGHPGDAYFSIRDDGAWSPSASRITGPPGLEVKSHNDGQSAQADFTATTPGPLPFTAAWTQTQAQDPEAGGCTASASATLTATAPTPVRVLRGLGYDAGDGRFQITAAVVANRRTGDRTPIRMTVRVVKRQRRPPASTHATTLTLDPNGPTRGVSASSPLLRLHAYIVDEGNEPRAEYNFQVRVKAPVAGGKTARRGVEIRLSQGSRALRTIEWATKCDGLHGGVFCYPALKDALN
jgi:hypothetical protein